RVVMAVGEAELVTEVDGDGPVDAVFRAIERMAGSHANLLLYSVNAITGGTDAQGEVTVRLEKAGRIVNGLGADTDIIVASAKAYINALNRLHDPVERVNPQRAA
ncbi:MAG TPA: alpha-isopropylmalate synthase regulatory domain-containing protein, partial [Casimicrobiaceae bacterium]|nr:alpha-isopropylmalate synthase regulatory domain-containing protein [Casimicrobiaceae bacterium]